MNVGERIVLIITTGIILLLFVITLGDYFIALKTGRELDADIITLLKMSITGLIGIIGGYLGGIKSNNQQGRRSSGED